MKAQELMLGDWVYGLYPNKERYEVPFRISAVDTYPSNRIRITNVRIERLQDISDEDCLKEGIKDYGDPLGQNAPFSFEGYGYYTPKKKVFHQTFFQSQRRAFAALIDRVSGKGTWQRNPWVFVYSFELVK